MIFQKKKLECTQRILRTYFGNIILQDSISVKLSPTRQNPKYAVSRSQTGRRYLFIAFYCTWRHRSDGLVTFDQIGGGRCGATGRRDGDDVGGAGRGGGRVDQRAAAAAAAGVQHDHGRRQTAAGTDDARSAAAFGRTHGTRTAVTSRVPARALGTAIFAASAVRRLMIVQVPDARRRRRRRPLTHLVYVLVIVLACGSARIAAAVRRRRTAKVLVRSGSGTAVAAVHLDLDCKHTDIAR